MMSVDMTQAILRKVALQRWFTEWSIPGLGMFCEVKSPTACANLMLPSLLPL